MNILIAATEKIPAPKYGGTERVVWSLGKELVKQGHRVTFLAAPGSECPFAKVIARHPDLPLHRQISEDIDLVHLHFVPGETIERPYLVTLHGNWRQPLPPDLNYVFVSKNHAARHGSESFVHNGLDWDDYGVPRLDLARNYFHFLGKASWRVKNVRGAIKIASKSGERLKVLGGRRMTIGKGSFRVTLNPRVSFAGMVGGEKKNRLINRSKGLILPVRWHEPFGLATIESLYFGCPVFATPYGSLPELVNDKLGFLSNREADLVEAVRHAGDYDRRKCHEYARDGFNSGRMALDYLERYERVLAGKPLSDTPAVAMKQEIRFLAYG